NAIPVTSGHRNARPPGGKCLHFAYVHYNDIAREAARSLAKSAGHSPRGRRLTSRSIRRAVLIAVDGPRGTIALAWSAMMNKRSGKKRQPPKNKHGAIPLLRVKRGAKSKEIHVAARRAFTAADLQKFTEIEEGIPAEQVVAELEAIYQEATQERKN